MGAGTTEAAEDRVEAWAEQFERDGFLALRSYFSGDEIDRAITATDEALSRHAPQVVVDDLAINERTFLAAARDPVNGRSSSTIFIFCWKSCGNWRWRRN